MSSCAEHGNRMLASVSGFLLTAAAASASATAPVPPRHILFFLIDDYGFADASYKNSMYKGAAAAPPTPTLDALAMNGVRLESYYVHSLCSPTRTALLSGRYSYTIGMSDTVIVNGQDTDMPLNLLTIADHFQRGGWNTSAYGKWYDYHLILFLVCVHAFVPQQHR